MNDPIYALATAPGRAAVAVMRVSGPDLGSLVVDLCGRALRPRQAALRTIRSEKGEAIDQGLVLWFPAPGSFTGEDVLELQLHGGVAIVEAVASALAAGGARPAEPGEFTRRAFEAGRLDLSQAEAIADLVDAETEAQRRQALLQLGGALAKRREVWRENLLQALAFLEAQIDFSEEDVPPNVAERAFEPLYILMSELEAAQRDVRGERIRDGLKIALIGAPNSGKSSLFNALLERDAAIVTAIPGTTRDVIEAPLTVGGYKVLLADMAGLRETSDPVEAEGVSRARRWAAEADLRLWLVDPQQGEVEDDFSALGGHDVLVLTKSDTWRELVPPLSSRREQELRTSTVNNEGLQQLRSFLERWVVSTLSGSDFPAVTRLRHRALLEEALACLRRGSNRPLTGAELIAEDVRLAARALERLAGSVDAEAVLDKVFGSFCIGK